MLLIICQFRKNTVPKEICQENVYFNYAATICAWLAFILVLFVVFKGDIILQQVATFYPELSFPVFFIPWFLLLISSVQKLRESPSKAPLQIWFLKTTIPIFVFVSPFFSQFLSAVKAMDNSVVIGFEPYCVYLAIITLFLLHFLPVFNPKPE